MTDFDSAEPGTSERTWRESGVRDRAAALDIGAIRRLVVLAAHPDDETLTAGGLMHAVAASGRSVTVIVASQGEASHPASTTTTPADLAVLRETELAAAVTALAPSATTVLLRLPDGGLQDRGPEVRAALEAHVGAGDTLVVPWRSDGHPDHEALGRAAADFATTTAVTVLEAPIWAWHWGDPETAWPQAIRFDLAAADSAAKERALAHHRSQIAPLSPAPGDETLLSAAMLEHFTGGSELFFPSGGAPVDFDAMYAESDDPWGFQTRWYERRKRAITVAALPREHYGRVLEIGSSIGLLAADLIARADSLLATDVASRAIELARARFADDQRVLVEQRRLPAEWPDGAFDLVVLSETGFYLTRDEVVELADRVLQSLLPDGHVLACHWRPHVAGLQLAGDEVHAILRERLGFAVVVEHVEDDFRLEVLAADPLDSVARRTGLR